MIVKLMKRSDITPHKENILFALSELFEFTGQPNFYASEKFDDLCRFLNEGSAYFLCAIENKHLLGFLWGYKRTLFDTKSIHITQLYVFEPYRNKGIAEELLHQIEQTAIKENISHIDLNVREDNDTAVHLYQKLLFDIDVIHMKKEIKNNDV